MQHKNRVGASSSAKLFPQPGVLISPGIGCNLVPDTTHRRTHNLGVMNKRKEADTRVFAENHRHFTLRTIVIIISSIPGRRMWSPQSRWKEKGGTEKDMRRDGAWDASPHCLCLRLFTPPFSPPRHRRRPAAAERDCKRASEPASPARTASSSLKRLWHSNPSCHFTFTCRTHITPADKPANISDKKTSKKSNFNTCYLKRIPSCCLSLSCQSYPICV